MPTNGTSRPWCLSTTLITSPFKDSTEQLEYYKVGIQRSYIHARTQCEEHWTIPLHIGYWVRYGGYQTPRTGDAGSGASAKSLQSWWWPPSSACRSGGPKVNQGTDVIIMTLEHFQVMSYFTAKDRWNWNKTKKSPICISVHYDKFPHIMFTFFLNIDRCIITLGSVYCIPLIFKLIFWCRTGLCSNVDWSWSTLDGLNYSMWTVEPLESIINSSAFQDLSETFYCYWRFSK